MAEGERRSEHFPTARRLGRLARRIVRPRHLLLLALVLVVLWFAGSFAVGVRAVRQVRDHPPAPRWADVALLCAEGNPLFMAHLRRIAFEDLQEDNAHIEFSLLLGTVEAEQGRELARQAGEMILTDLRGPSAQAWAQNPWSLHNWATLLEAIGADQSLEVARAGLAVVPPSHQAHLHLHRFVSLRTLPESLRRIEPLMTLHVPVRRGPGATYNLLFHPTEPALVAETAGGLVAFDLETGAMREFAADCSVTDHAIDPSGRVLALLDRNTRQVHFHDWQTGAEIGRWGVTNAEPQQLHFLDADTLLVHWKYARPNMQTWSLSQAAVTGGHAVSEEPTSRLDFDFSGDRYASRWLWGPQVTVHRAWDGSLAGPLVAPPPRLASHALIDDGQSLLLLAYGPALPAGLPSIRMGIWDVETGTLSQAVTGESAVGVRAVDLHRDAQVGLHDPGRGFLILDRETLSPEAILASSFADFPSHAVSDDGSLVAIGSFHAAEILVYELTDLDETADP